MDDWADYISEQYEYYMAQNCTCARSDDDCNCMTFKQFEANYIKHLQDQWAEEAWYAHQEKIECQI
jgi:hypothetical protein